MKAKLIAGLVLLLCFSLVSLSMPADNRDDQSAEHDSAGQPFPSCFHDETAGRSMTGRSRFDSPRTDEFVGAVTDNPLEAAFVEVSCLFASRF